MSNNQISKLKLDPSADGIEYDMKKTVETKEDGRQLIYYTFVRKAAADNGTTVAARESERETAREPKEHAAKQANQNPMPMHTKPKKKHATRGGNR